MVPGSIDFQRAIATGSALVYPRFGTPGEWIGLPLALDLARRAGGRPDFQLDLVRHRQALDGALTAYGIVDMRVLPASILDARTTVKGTVTEGTLGTGWLRLLVVEPDRERRTMLPPLRVRSSGPGGIRLAARLTAQAAALLKQALLGGTVLVDAWAEMEITGVAPRQPLVVTLQTSRLAQAIAADVHEGLVSRASVINALARPDVIGPLPPDLDPADAAEAAADRLRNACATLVPSPGTDIAEWWRLDLGTAETTLRWDLAGTAPATRIHLLRFDPVALVRATEAGDAGRFIVERELPQFDTGLTDMLVTANLPTTRSPALSCGVDITAAPAPPHRMHALRETVEFTAPLDRAEVRLRFAPGEPRTCQVQTFVFANLRHGVTEYRAAARPHPGGDLRLDVTDFPVRWIPASATSQLVTAGALSIVARWSGHSQAIDFDRTRPSDTFLVPLDARPLDFELSLRSDGRTIARSVSEADLRFLDLALFPEYGAHSVEISIDFAGIPTVIALDLMPEDGGGDAVTLSFSVTSPARTWTWFARSPFAPGFRYRLFQSGGPARAWSQPQPAFSPLRLSARDLIGAVAS
jgi:hypothetical protein